MLDYNQHHRHAMRAEGYRCYNQHHRHVMCAEGYRCYNQHHRHAMCAESYILLTLCFLFCCFQFFSRLVEQINKKSWMQQTTQSTSTGAARKQLVNRNKLISTLQALLALTLWVTKNTFLTPQVVSTVDGLMLSVLDLLRVPGRALGVIVLCSWARHFTLTVPLSTQEY